MHREAETPNQSTKFQTIPKSKIQIPKRRPKLLSSFGISAFGFCICLGFGAWNLVFPA
jgi:hypothetical protein